MLAQVVPVAILLAADGAAELLLHHVPRRHMPKEVAPTDSALAAQVADVRVLLDVNRREVDVVVVERHQRHAAHRTRIRHRRPALSEQDKQI